MHKRKHCGFTIVEVVVVMVLLVGFLTLSVVGVRGLRLGLRDRERRADIESMAIDLESVYGREIRRTDTTILKPAGSYMPVKGGYTTSLSISSEMLGFLDKSATLAPDQDATSLFTVPKTVCTSSSTATHCYVTTTTLNNETTAAKITDKKYFYVPIARDGELCTEALLSSNPSSACRSFKLYSVLEGSPTVVQVKESKSK